MMQPQVAKPAAARKRSRQESTLIGKWASSARNVAPPPTAIRVEYTELSGDEVPNSVAKDEPSFTSHDVVKSAQQFDVAAFALSEICQTRTLIPSKYPSSQHSTALPINALPHYLGVSGVSLTGTSPTLRDGLRTLMLEHGLTVADVSSLIGVRGTKTLETWLVTGEQEEIEATVAAAAKWATMHASAVSAALERGLAATAQLGPEAQMQYAHTVSRAAGDAASLAARAELFPVPIDAIPHGSALAQRYAAEIAAAQGAAAAEVPPTAASAAASGASLPAATGKIHVAVQGSDAAVLRRARVEFRRVEAGVHELLRQAEQQRAWEGRGAPRNTAAAAAAVATAADDAPVASLRLDHWGQARMSSGGGSSAEAPPRLWAPLLESPLLAAHADAGHAAALASLLALPVTEGPDGRGAVDSEALRPTPLPCKEEGAAGAQAEAYFARVVAEQQGAVQEAVYVAAADAAPAPAAAAAPASRTALAVDSVVRVLDAFSSSEAATSNSYLLQSASLVPAGRGPVTPVDIDRTPAARPPRPAWGPRAVDPPGSLCRLYAPGAERGLPLLGALLDQTKATLRASM